MRHTCRISFAFGVFSPTFRCSLRHSRPNSSVYSPNNRWDNQVLVRNLCKLVGLFPEISLGPFRLYDEKNDKPNGVIPTVTSFLSHRFYATVDLDAQAIVILSYYTSVTSMNLMIMVVQMCVFPFRCLGSRSLCAYAYFCTSPSRPMSIRSGPVPLSFYPLVLI